MFKGMGRAPTGKRAKFAAIGGDIYLDGICLFRHQSVNAAEHAAQGVILDLVDGVARDDLNAVRYSDDDLEEARADGKRDAREEAAQEKEALRKTLNRRFEADKEKLEEEWAQHCSEQRDRMQEKINEKDVVLARVVRQRDKMVAMLESLVNDPAIYKAVMIEKPDLLNALEIGKFIDVKEIS